MRHLRRQARKQEDQLGGFVKAQVRDEVGLDQGVMVKVGRSAKVQDTL